MWQPARVTTFVLPVIEIEAIIQDLQDNLGLSDDAFSTDDSLKPDLSKQLENWVTVLSNYRRHNSDLTAMFSAETVQFMTMVSAFQQYQSNSISLDDFNNAVDSGGLDPGSFMDLYNKAFGEISQSCASGFNARTDYTGAICADFDNGVWQTFGSVLSGACNMPGSPNDQTNPLSNSVLISSICKQGSSPDGSTIPGGMGKSGGTESLFSFMQNPSKLVTFSANSPVRMKWKAEVSDELDFSNYLSVTTNSLFTLKNDFEATFGTANVHNIQSRASRNSYKLSLGKGSSSGHKFEREVEIYMSDEDIGTVYLNEVNRCLLMKQ